MCYFQILKFHRRDFEVKEPLAMLPEMARDRNMLTLGIATIATVLEKLLRFITQFADISARFYYKELMEFGADLAFSIWHRA